MAVIWGFSQQSFPPAPRWVSPAPLWATSSCLQCLYLMPSTSLCKCQEGLKVRAVTENLDCKFCYELYLFPSLFGAHCPTKSLSPVDTQWMGVHLAHGNPFAVPTSVVTASQPISVIFLWKAWHWHSLSVCLFWPLWMWLCDAKAFYPLSSTCLKCT